MPAAHQAIWNPLEAPRWSDCSTSAHLAQCPHSCTLCYLAVCKLLALSGQQIIILPVSQLSAIATTARSHCQLHQLPTPGGAYFVRMSSTSQAMGSNFSSSVKSSGNLNTATLTPILHSASWLPEGVSDGLGRRPVDGRRDRFAG